MLLRRSLVCAVTALGLFLAAQLVLAVTTTLTEKNNLSGAAREYFDEWTRTSEIDSYQQRLEAKRATLASVAGDVAERRLSMAEGIERYRELYPQGVDTLMPGETDDEKLGRCLIRWAENELQDAPSQGSERISELEDDLRRHLASRQETVSVSESAVGSS